ncbi:hypothetical protein NDU88_005583 [Pleurodeles waltl]|uniref:Uncharacterized protein n=1 Tax=Pleurodeles waltl TaxID=8319 RepID=A0AAV7W882_PLEWA|nr:hypothetical protein NDU88_005583 [Pleurodeles waltl]
MRATRSLGHNTARPRGRGRRGEPFGSCTVEPARRTGQSEEIRLSGTASQEVAKVRKTARFVRRALDLKRADRKRSKGQLERATVGARVGITVTQRRGKGGAPCKSPRTQNVNKTNTTLTK